MSDRIHVTIALDLFVEDSAQMREAAFERLRSAWSGDEDFPYESAADVPLGEAVHSLVADALPADLPGCRRSQLEIEINEGSDADPQTASGDEPEATSNSDAAPSGEGEDKDPDAEPQSTPD
jgi:hypothetical protein